MTCKIRMGMLALLTTAFTNLMATGLPVDSIAVEGGKSVVDEVIWVVGDEAILKSDVEAMRKQAEEEGTRWKG